MIIYYYISHKINNHKDYIDFLQSQEELNKC